LLYIVNGGPEVVQNQVASIAAGGTYYFYCKSWLDLAGDYTITVYTKLVIQILQMMLNRLRCLMLLMLWQMSQVLWWYVDDYVTVDDFQH
jgi:hypothetical protein